MRIIASGVIIDVEGTSDSSLARRAAFALVRELFSSGPLTVADFDGVKVALRLPERFVTED